MGKNNKLLLVSTHVTIPNLVKENNSNSHYNKLSDRDLQNALKHKTPKAKCIRQGENYSL